MVLGDIDAFWSAELGGEGFDYYAAGITPVSDVVQSSCGQFGPYDNPAAYCPLDDPSTSPCRWRSRFRPTSATFAWITILAHEWGHHVQLVLGLQQELSIDRDCRPTVFPAPTPSALATGLSPGRRRLRSGPDHHAQRRPDRHGRRRPRRPRLRRLPRYRLHAGLPERRRRRVI